MTVEIWSDVACPFCYIGKRKFERALAQFDGTNEVHIEWRSFQLDPEAKPVPGKTQAQVLAAKKGWSLEQTENIMRQITNTAAEVGLDFRMNDVVIANTLKAHQLTHLAKQYGLQHAVEEGLFKAYFTDGLNVADELVLRQIGINAGIPEEAIDDINNNELARAVAMDQLQASHLGIRSVPFFVFNKKFAVSGAQSAEVFLQALHKAREEEKPAILAGGASCGPDGICN